jgi:hypothetical protein
MRIAEFTTFTKKRARLLAGPDLVIIWIVERASDQPLVTTGAGALPLPIGTLPLPAQPATPSAKIAEQMMTRNVFMTPPSFPC